jgi:hypothetical protein
MELSHLDRVEPPRARAIRVDGPVTLGSFARSNTPRAEYWADDFVLARELLGAAERGRLYRAVETGDLTRVRPGVYLPTAIWMQRNDDERHLDRVRAAALAFERPVVFASASAAALWRLPTASGWPQHPTAVGDRAPGGRSSSRLRVNSDGMPSEVWVVDGLAATSLPRTVVDVARRGGFEAGVVMADRVLAPARRDDRGVHSFRTTRDELRSALRALAVDKGAARVLAVIEFADGLSGSVGESVSRVTIHVLGFPAPILQQEFRDTVGRMYTDFWWPEFRLIGEFDGRGKYLRDEFTRGRSTAQVVIEEKLREDRLRALGPRVMRFGWEEARSPAAMRRTLLAAGLPLER